MVRGPAEGAAPQVSQAQARLTAFQKEKGILADDRVDIESARLAELSTQLLAARNATYDAQARHKQATEIVESGASPDALPEVLSNAYITAVKADLGRAEARLERSTAVLGPNHPHVPAHAAEVQGLRDKLQAEMKKVVAGLGNSVQQQRAGASRSCRRRSTRRTSACSS